MSDVFQRRYPEAQPFEARAEAAEARVRSLEEALADCVEEIRACHMIDGEIRDEFTARAYAKGVAALSDTPREEWNPSGFDIKHDPNEPLPSYHWDFEAPREEGKT